MNIGSRSALKSMSIFTLYASLISDKKRRRMGDIVTVLERVTCYILPHPTIGSHTTSVLAASAMDVGGLRDM